MFEYVVFANIYALTCRIDINWSKLKLICVLT